jgi:hypothetical protein
VDIQLNLNPTPHMDEKSHRRGTTGLRITVGM